MTTTDTTAAFLLASLERATKSIEGHRANLTDGVAQGYRASALGHIVTKLAEAEGQASVYRDAVDMLGQGATADQVDRILTDRLTFYAGSNDVDRDEFAGVQHAVRTARDLLRA